MSGLITATRPPCVSQQLIDRVMAPTINDLKALQLLPEGWPEKTVYGGNYVVRIIKRPDDKLESVVVVDKPILDDAPPPRLPGCHCHKIL